MTPTGQQTFTRVRLALARVGRIARIAWIAIGAVLLVVLAAEGAYRAQAALRRSLRRVPTTQESPQVSRLRMETVPEGTLQWRPYVYYRRRPMRGMYVTVDSAGIRRTTPQIAAVNRRSVMVFGASPIWGTMLGDSMTIPSRLGARLASRGFSDVQVMNLGETGYVFTQEVLELIQHLRAGQRPTAVLFYHGYNDVAAGLEGQVGATKGESQRARDFEAGAKLFSWQPTLGADIGAVGTAFGIAAKRLQLVRRVFGDGVVAPRSDDEVVARQVAQSYASTIEIVEALGKHFGFVPYFTWMALLDEREKPLSDNERKIFDASQRGGGRRFLQVYRRVRALLVAPGALQPSGRFVDMSNVFARDSVQRFIDDLGHVTEAGSDIIARSFEQMIAPSLPPAR
jgi:hypothetical protein